MRRVLVVRERDEFSRILEENGFSVINCPAIETVKTEDLSDLAAKLKNVEIYDGIFLTSAAATAILLEKLEESSAEYDGAIYVLGKRSFDLTKKTNLHVVYFETANTAREMLERIALEDLKGKRFLFVRGDKSLRVVPEFLSEIAAVDEVAVYRTEKVRMDCIQTKTLGEMLAAGSIECAVFFSPSGAESFFEQCGARILHQTKIATIGRTTAEFVENQGCRVDFIAGKSAAENFAFELVEYLEKKAIAPRAEKVKR